MATIINGDGIVTAEGTSTTQGRVRLGEDTDNGTNYVELQAPASVASNVTFTLPSADGTNGQVLQTNGSGALSFANSGALPVGALQYFMGATTTTYPGSGWLKCDGSVYTQTAYSDLYNKIGLYTNVSPFVWTEQTTGTADNLALIYGNNLFVSTGGGDRIYTSTDGVTWDLQTAATTSNRNALTYGNNLYVTAGDVGNLSTSTDGVTWTAQTSGTTSSIRALVYGNNLYVYAGWGGMIATSTDAVTWTARTSGTTSNLFSLAYANGLYLVGGTGGTLRTSTDAITWTARTSSTSSAILSIVYGGGIYVYGGAAGALGTSYDGITWRSRTSGITVDIKAVAYGAGVFLRSGSTTNNPAISYDGVSWINVTGMNTTVTMNAITYGNGTFVYGANFNRFGRSSAFTYNTATEFAVPNGNLLFSDAPVYIKATT